MNNDHPLKAVAVVTATALLCSILVTVTAVTLRPIKRAHQDLARNRDLIALSGLVEDVTELDDKDVVRLFRTLDARIVNLDGAQYDTRFDPDTFDTWKAATDPALSVAIATDIDAAKLGRRSRVVTVYLVRDKAGPGRLILPLYGQGMWSTIYGFIALEADLNTIADIAFFEQAETAGIGDQILRPDWLATWRGRRLFDESGELRFAVSKAKVEPSSPASAHHVDAISGASVTTDAVSAMVRYWFGPNAFGPFLVAQRAQADR